MPPYPRTTSATRPQSKRSDEQKLGAADFGAYTGLLQMENKYHQGIFGYSEDKRTPSVPASVFNSRDAVLDTEKVLQSEGSEFSNAYFQVIAEAIPQIVWTAQPDGYQDYFNKRWFTYTGLTEEETYSGKTALHPDDFETYVDRWSRAINEGMSYEAEYRFLHGPSGAYRWHLVRGVPIRNTGGEIIKWVGTFTDIHDQKSAEEKMRKLNEELEEEVNQRTRLLKKLREKDRVHLQRMKDIIESMRFSAILIDENEVVLHKNQRFRAVFQLLDQPSLIGRTAKDFLESIEPAFESKQSIQKVRRFLSSRIPQYEEDFTLADGRILQGEFLTLFQANTYRGHLLVFRDITNERRSDAVKSEFTSLASHQLRTPLTSLRWALGRLQKKLTTPEQRTLATEMHKATKNMSETINTMLAISNLRAGTTRLKVDTVNLHRLLMSLRDDSTEMSTYKSQTIEVECPEDLSIQTDRRLLKEILRNLVINASKYSPEKTTIRIEAKHESGGAVLKVIDEGYGIPEREQEKIFGKFYRGTNVLDRETNGTGLGLYLTALIVRVLQARISFVSKEHEGTAFTVRLPTAIQMHQ